MGRFFHGWRRKAGCIVLALATLLFVAWMRSLTTTDIVLPPATGNHYPILSTGGSLQFWMMRDSTIECDRWLSRPRRGTEWERRLNLLEGGPNRLVPWRYAIAGIAAGRVDSTVGGTRSTTYVVRVQYSSLILMLSLSSAYLIFRKPRLLQRLTASDIGDLNDQPIASSQRTSDITLLLQPR